MSTLLDVKGLRGAYGRLQVLHGLDFTIGQGAVTCLLGANGSGKTSTLRALCGMIRVSGTATLEDTSIVGKATEDIVRLGVAHVPEGRGTFTRMTVEENLQLGAITRSSKTEIDQDIQRCFAYFPRLAERRAQQAGTLSGGEQQMLAISRAMMLRPKLLLLDEPSFGLAPLVVEEMFRILGKLNREEKVSMLVVEQNAAMALELADHAYLLETGRIVLSGPANEIANDDTVRKAYLGY
ncbi:high-affinity branched-chain amino acid transport ATP-binding protein LivF [Variibacter gotjawalensis]|uniref:High-affinity branched-chain amino acid transport ATP-binding protein LivF n=1 Tax=Variibacter gotjawalensis TaxID=1333996 RepID=A0A0S3PPK7_9BRAD|nr:ABC transporter ATP-binding protein [Variibacter gotjawalensis]NIK48146.1 branched-chain amino acid transport system ATP-binding protein [Variibacter gotjawalensis]RZS50020.1 amino acid/amide ABC transporter ATP-binding protein 2 (HAAT family) [Variibacter gotjawalensis]BAT57849.1 high-affinity branched-chain amino acid transport ATP-binding protein LivF [Variibacter gotjawalensis]